MLFEDFDISSIKEHIDSLHINKKTALQIFIAEETETDFGELFEYLNLEDITFFGGIFPGIIYNNKSYKKGLIIDQISIIGKPLLIPDLDDHEEYLQINDIVLETLSERNLTAITLVDGLSRDIEPFLHNLQNCVGSKVNFIGGGTGSVTLKQFPSIFSNEGVFQNAAVIVFSDHQSKMNVQHGWEKIMGPFIATRTHKNIIKELNWKKAVDVYREIVENDAGEKITSDNFFQISKGYPFGMYKTLGEDIVRDPIAVNDFGELICVGIVPENAVLNILKGAEEVLHKAAKKAAADFVKNGAVVCNAMIFDCISRSLFMGNNFDNELEMVKESFPFDNNIYGAQSLGEISSYGKGIIEFFNKTVVIGILYD